MKHHPDLVEYSREHHHALVLAKKACALIPGSDASRKWLAEFAHAWHQDLAPHFDLEEQKLLPVLARGGQDAAVQRLLDEHACMRLLAERLLAGEDDLAAAFGLLLTSHVRFEERELFPQYEDRLAQKPV